MIYGFMHVYQVNHWKSIVNEQIQKMINSNLFTWMEKLYIGVNGDTRINFYRDLNDKIEVLYQVMYPELYEAMTLSFLRIFCQNLCDNDYVFYVHTKGVSRTPEKQNYADWRHLMEHFVIERYQKCIDELENGSDIVGVNWHLGEGYQSATAAKCGGTPVTPHFSGNFWWAAAGYIKTLPALYPMISKYDCEFWHGLADPLVSELWNSGVRHHKHGYHEDSYKGKLNVKYH